MTAKATKKAASKKKPEAAEDRFADLKFEDAMESLEDVVQKLEGGDVPLEESLEAFERGVALVRTLHTRLDAVQEKIEELTAGDRGEPRATEVEFDED